MKKESKLLLGFIVAGLIVFSACPTPTKVLLYQQDGNFLIDNNYLLQSATKMSDGDISDLVGIDSAFKKLTLGAAMIYHNFHVSHIDHGCLQKAQIDWTKYGDLGKRIDFIKDKYKASLIDGNLSIQNDRIATAAVKLAETDITAISALSAYGQDEYTICPEQKGIKNLNRITIFYRSMPLDISIRQKFETLVTKYQMQGVK